MSNKLQSLSPIYTEFYRSLNCKSGNGHEAADIAQASVERFLMLPEEQEVRSPAGLLRQIARNMKIDMARHRQRLPMESLESRADADFLPGLSHDFDPERIFLGQERVALLSQAVDSMPARCREAFILSRIDGLAHHEVATGMGISPSMVEKHVALGLKICRQFLDQ
ncbi:sigma-70 family RNA polymerase sigma factor [Pseudomonas sp. GM33]|uniref:sigma-70 family RNA polymerase sigma factor n=1 Tax=Pseudomonas sp. GM33 TaxID=1144329 RepID=UPI0006ACD3F7|nr:sigma-70 family RNA polymerase sigma factor [Pseudomonas sp. GM33]